MESNYNPTEHIQRLEISPYAAEDILDQREISIQSYTTTVPFNFDHAVGALDGAWLSPKTRFGVFSHKPSIDDSPHNDAINIVLGLQDELSIRTYDYTERKPLWFTWKNVVVDTVKVHYFKNHDDGLLHFTTTGGGRRITDKLIEEFNSNFLGIPKDAVTKKQFDPERLRDMCFTRFIEQLYMIRFSDPSGDEYKSIEHAQFQSRKYIDPKSERMNEVTADDQVKVESFDSDIDVSNEDLANPISVRFFIRGGSGSLRLRFPKVYYKKQLKTLEEQTRVFYRLVDTASRAILDSDYYARQYRTLDDLDEELGLFPGDIPLEPYKEVLISEEQRNIFFDEFDIHERCSKWLPHLQALNLLIQSDAIFKHVEQRINQLVDADPSTVHVLLRETLRYSRLSNIARIAATAIVRAINDLPAEMRPHAEEVILAWAVAEEWDSWDVLTDNEQITVMGLRWPLEGIVFKHIPAIFLKLLTVLHHRMIIAEQSIDEMLVKFHWCVLAIKALPTNIIGMAPALRMIIEGRIPRNIKECASILKTPVGDLASMDKMTHEQFGLPLWPLPTVSLAKGVLRIENKGIGPLDKFTACSGASEVNVPTESIESGKHIDVITEASLTSLTLRFEKFGRIVRVDLAVFSGVIPERLDSIGNKVPAALKKSRLRELAEYRKKVDPQGLIVGDHPALLKVFSEIQYALAMGETTPILLLGEPGVGKTHIAKIIHQASERRKGPFVVANASGTGGDLNIQRGEWIGHGKGHGIQGINKDGQAGHLMNAESGTLFIDEFAEMSSDMQNVFRAVLEEHPVQKVGGESYKPNARCILAANVNIDEAVLQGKLRRDLVDRLSVRITIPSLRDRESDVISLARHFVNGCTITDRGLLALLKYSWPGNIRELSGTMTKAVAKAKIAKESFIDVLHLDLPESIMSELTKIEDNECRSSLWKLADRLAKAEGFESGAGLQKRAGEIMGVHEGQASKMYKQHLVEA